jgi:hypothetical protein
MKERERKQSKEKWGSVYTAAKKEGETETGREKNNIRSIISIIF